MTHPNHTAPVKKTPVALLGTPWPPDRVLAEARKRAKQLAVKNTLHTSQMLEKLLKEAGWSTSDFLDLLTRDLFNKIPVPYPMSRG